MTSGSKPRVYLVGTGGSISFVGRTRTDYTNYSYDRKHLTIDELLARVPEVLEFAEVRTEQFLNLGSTDVTPEHWLGLAKRINQIFQAKNRCTVMHRIRILDIKERGVTISDFRFLL